MGLVGEREKKGGWKWGGREGLTELRSLLELTSIAARFVLGLGLPLATITLLTVLLGLTPLGVLVTDDSWIEPSEFWV